MEASIKEPPLFDSPKAALVFALNADQVEMPRPFMNKAMAEAPTKKKTKKAKKMLADHGVEEREVVRKMNTGPTPVRLRGFEKAAQAGFILQQFARLDQEHQVVLTGLLARAYDPCLCQRVCCSGWAVNPRWRQATTDMCLILKESGDVLKTPGKKGLSTQPALRMALVEQFFTKRPVSVTDLAASCEVSHMTVATHRAWINGYLEQVETEAWLSIQDIFDQSGVTGFVE